MLRSWIPDASGRHTGRVDVGTTLVGGDDAHSGDAGGDDGHSGDDGQDVQSLSVADSDADSTEAKKGKGTRKVVNDDEPWDEADEEYVGINDENQYMSDQEHVVQYAEPTDYNSIEHDVLFVDYEAVWGFWACN